MAKKIMIVLFFLGIGFPPHAPAAEWVTFKSTETAGKKPLSLTGKLTKPEGQGPFPAAVLLHGCGGISRQRDDIWAERLVGWGYVALQVDSFKPRGESNVCAERSLLNRLVPKRARDAYDAKSALAGFSFVDGTRIILMGWSHGGSSTLSALNPKTWTGIRHPDGPFRAAVAFYPYCGEPLGRLEAPLLILIGERDDWTPAYLCQKHMPPGQTQHEVALKVYPGAYHGFDSENVDRMVKGSSGLHQMRSDPAATADAVVQVKNFLEKHLEIPTP